MNPFEWQVNSDFLDIISFLDLFLIFYFVTEVKCTKLIIAHVHFDNKFPSHSSPPVNRYSVIGGHDSHQFSTLFYNTDLRVQSAQIHLTYRSLGSSSAEV